MPMTWGGFRPVVLLPAEADSWSVDRRRDVLLHELAHVRRLDCLTQWIARAACAVYWFNPLAWVAARRMRIERERACDDVVLLAGARASDYAGHLLEIARGLRIPIAAATAALAMARPSQLEGRLVAILDPDRRRRGPGRRAAGVAMLATIVAVVPMAMLRLGTRANAATAPEQGPIAGQPAADDPAARMTVTGRVLDPLGQAGARRGRDGPRGVEERRTGPRSPSPASRRSRDMGAATARAGSGSRCPARPRRGTYRLVATAVGARLRHRLDRARPRRRLALSRHRPAARAGHPGADLRRPGPARSEAGPVGPVGPYHRARGHLELDLPARLPRSALARTARLARPGGQRRRGPIHPARDRAGGRAHAPDRRSAVFPPARLPLDVRPRPGPADQRPRSRGSTSSPARRPGRSSSRVEPARRIVGRVTYADTGRPVPHAVVAVDQVRYEADGEGRFRIPVIATLPALAVDRYAIQAQSPDPGPYLTVGKQGQWPKGAVEQSVELALPRGTLLHGKVTEEGTGRPVAGAVVAVIPAVIPRDPRRGMVGFTRDGSGRHLPARRTPGTVLSERASLRRLRAPRDQRRPRDIPGPEPTTRPALHARHPGHRREARRPRGVRLRAAPGRDGPRPRPRPRRPPCPRRLVLQPARAQEHADGRLAKLVRHR